MFYLFLRCVAIPLCVVVTITILVGVNFLYISLGGFFFSEYPLQDSKAEFEGIYTYKMTLPFVWISIILVPIITFKMSGATKPLPDTEVNGENHLGSTI